jgi:hypothetical protein
MALPTPSQLAAQRQQQQEEQAPEKLTEEQLDLIRRSVGQELPLLPEESRALMEIPREQRVPVEQSIRTGLENLNPELARQRGIMAQYTPESSRFTGAVETISGERYRPSEFTEKVVAPIAGPIGATLQATGIEDFAMGINKVLAYLPDAAINTVVRGMEKAGIVDEGTIDRDILTRIFNSPDYESQKIIIPYIMAYGTGEEIGTVKGMGKIGRPAGEFTGMAAPFAVMTRAAALTPTGGIISGKTGADVTAIAMARSKAPSIFNLRLPGQGTAVRETMLGPYRLNPVTAGSMELGVSAVSGVGAGLEQEMFGTQTGAGTLLPFAPMGLWYVAQKGPLASGFRWMSEKISPYVDTAISEYNVARQNVDAKAGPRGESAISGLQDEILFYGQTPQGQANLSKAAEIETTFQPYGEVKLSPAERTGSPSFAKSEMGAVERGDAEYNRSNNQRKNRALQAADNYINQNFSGSGIDDAPLYIINQADGTYQATVNGIDAELNGLTDTFNLWANARSGVYPEMGSTNQAGLGRDIRTQIIGAHNQAKEDAKNLATTLKINDNDEILDPTNFRASRINLRRQFQNANGTESLDYEGLPSQVRRYIENKNEMLSFQEWKSFRDQVSSAIGSASAKGNKTDVRNLAILAEELDSVAAGFGQVNKDFENFRVWYDTNVIQPYERYGTIRIRSTGAGSTPEGPVYIVPDEQVASSFLENSNTTREFANIFGDNKIMMDRMARVVLDDVRQKTYNARTGVFDPDKLNTYINQNTEKLRVLDIDGVPLDQQLRDTQKLINASVQRQAELQGRRDAIDSNQLVRLLAKDGENPEKVLTNAINNPSVMGELKNTLTAGLSGAALANRERTLRRAVWSVMTRNQPDIADNPETFLQFLDRNHRSLIPAFGEEHLNNLQLVGEMVRRLKSTSPGGKLERGMEITPASFFGEGGQLEALTGTSVRGLSTLARATAEGRISALSAISYVLSRAYGKSTNLRNDAIIREMIFDPDLTSTLLNRKVNDLGDLDPATMRTINRWLFNNGIGYGMNSTGALDVEPPEPVDVFIPLSETPETPDPRMQPQQIRMQGLPRQPDSNAVDASRLPPNRTAPAPAATPAPAAAPAAAPPQAATQTPTASELFPFDPTLSAIERRRGQPQGIASLA